MAVAKGPARLPVEIGARARAVRRRRGMSLATVAGLAGISKSYLSMLESGDRRFERLGLIERLAEALGCSVLDLTGQVYGPPDRTGAETLAAMPTIARALYDCTLDDPPDMLTRPLGELAELVRAANAAHDLARYDAAGRGMGQLLTELQVVAATSRSEPARQDALALLVEACLVTHSVAASVGRTILAAEAAGRGYESAQRLDNAALVGFAAWGLALALRHIGAHRRTCSILVKAIEDLEPVADPGATDTACAEAYGMLHLVSAVEAATFGKPDDARDHLDEAARIAERTGERNTLLVHFGPANVGACRITVGAELGEGAANYERMSNAKVALERLGSATLLWRMHLDLARLLAREGGPRDWDAVRHLDQAERIAPSRVRNDPVARELLRGLECRVRWWSWELSSLRHRFGLDGARFTVSEPVELRSS